MIDFIIFRFSVNSEIFVCIYTHKKKPLINILRGCQRTILVFTLWPTLNVDKTHLHFTQNNFM